MQLFLPLTLPNGAVIPNRIAKAAMEENMADSDHAPSEALLRLYRAWAEGEAGLILTGNVMVDARAMTGPGGVVLEDETHLDRFKAWVAAGRAQGAQLWMQINHPGRQMPAALGQPTLAPSARALDLGAQSGLFGLPREMVAADIAEVQQRFVRTAQLAEKAGFTGVQIHAAHGYLLSQFLSPLSNHRQDAWGGSLENRARLLLDIVRGVRAVVAPGFAVSVKLNSADFQRGGFAFEDSLQVARWLEAEGLENYVIPLAIRLQFEFAGRRSEICTLEWSWIDLENRRVVWPDSKTGGLSKPMSAEAHRLLSTAPRREGCPYVLPSPNDPARHLTFGEHYGGWCRVLKAAGVPHVGTHGIRHRSTTDIANSGVPTKVGMKLTGHKTVAMFMHYVHTEDKPVRDAAELVASRRQAITGARQAEGVAA